MLAARRAGSRLRSKAMLRICGPKERRMGSAADYTIIVLVAALGAGIWTLFDKVTQLQRDVEAIRRKLEGEGE